MVTETSVKKTTASGGGKNQTPGHDSVARSLQAPEFLAINSKFANRSHTLDWYDAKAIAIALECVAR
jgi:hypothetical protein